MKANQISGVHVDCVNHDASKAAAGFICGEHRFHVWFKPATKALWEPILYKNPITRERYEPRRTPTMRLNPDAAANKPALAEMWRQIDASNMIAEAIRMASYESVWNDAENDNIAFDLDIKLRERARECLAIPGDDGTTITTQQQTEMIERIVAAMKWAQTQ